MKKEYLLILIALTLTSCATIINSPTTKIKISADKKSKIIFNSDTIAIHKKQTTIRPKRSSESLKITFVRDSIKKDFLIDRKISSVFWLNIYNYGVGALIDLTSDKLYRYRNNIHFSLDTTSNSISLGRKKTTLIPKKTLFIYTTPLRTINPFSIPSATLGAEYFIKQNISISAEYGIKLPNIELSNTNEKILKDKSSIYRLESKYYNAINLTKNVHLNEYLGFEIIQKRSQFNDNISYFEKNNNNPEDIVKIDDLFGVKKQATIINLKYGLLVPINERFYFDFYTGLGIRLKRFKSIDKEFNPEIHEIYYEDRLPFFDFNESYGTDSNLPNFSLGFKFGIKL